jgi:hypothetical protein
VDVVATVVVLLSDGVVDLEGAADLVDAGVVEEGAAPLKEVAV